MRISDWSSDVCSSDLYGFSACPFGAPQYPQAGNFGSRGKMDKCTFCAGGPETDHSSAEFQKYGRNRLAEGKLPRCAEMCSTKALLGGDGDRSEEHTSELQSLMRISYAVFCLKKKKNN